MHPLICPSCRNDLALADLRPGRFRIACPRCAAHLIVTVAADPAATIDVQLEALPTPAPVEPDLTVEPVRSGRVGRYRVVGAGQGRAGRFGPVVGLHRVRDRWRTDARFVAAWTLEALAASVLKHPNLASPIGLEVAGEELAAIGPAGAASTLADPTTRSQFDRQGRVATVLHAARGLRAAHEQQVYHRDLGLGSIRIEADGLVRVAGLGVGLNPSSTAPRSIEPIPLAELGTSPVPVALPPTPDAQTDVAGLGRVLGTLVAGSSGDRAVPPGLATLIRRLTGGDGSIDPRERFADMGAVVRGLEAELGVAGPLVPAEVDAVAFEAAVGEFQAAPLATIEHWVPIGAGVVLGLIVLGCLLLGRLAPALGWVFFGGLIAVAGAGFRVWDTRGRIGGKLGPAAAVVESRDGLTLGVVGLVGFGLLWMMEWLGVAILGSVLAIALAATYHFGLDRPLAASRNSVLGQLRGLIQGWRRLGWDEEAIRRYVASSGGRAWEEIFAALFGFDAVPEARARWGANLAGERRPRFAPVRAGLLDRGNAWITRRLDERTQGWLEPIIERDLEAGGLHVLTARRRSKRASAAVVAVLDQFRRAPDGTVGTPLVAALRRAVDRTEEVLASPEIAEAARSAPWYAPIGSIVLAPMGRWARFALGLACLAGALVWMERNELINYTEIKDAVRAAMVEGNQADARHVIEGAAEAFQAGVARIRNDDKPPEALRLGVIPLAFARHLDGFALLTTGLILIFSCLIPDRRIIPFALVAALLPLAPHFLLTNTRPLGMVAITAMVLGASVLVLGMVTDRRDES